MNQKELAELRRRLAPNKNSISHIYICYVNGNREIITSQEESVGMLSDTDAEMYFGLLKKVLSGEIGKNQLDIVFSNEQVMDSDEHRLLTALRESRLKDAEARDNFFRRVIESVNMEGVNYLILLACDTYDVPTHAKDGEKQEDSETSFTYIVCGICPVKNGKTELEYIFEENGFHSRSASQIASMPELGFLFPAFDHRAANIYNALFYTKNPAAVHQEFIDGVFHTEAIMSSDEQKETFQTVLAESLDDDFNFDVVQSVHSQLCERVELHRESKTPEPLNVSPAEVGDILQASGVSEEHIQTFRNKCDEHFGTGAALKPKNIIETRKFEVVTPQVKISVAPEYSSLIESRLIDGKRYILIPADEGVEVNGANVAFSED